MKFYNREKELEALNKVRELSFNKHSMLTVLTGRRRIGKTLLIKEVVTVLLQFTCLCPGVMRRLCAVAMLMRSGLH